MKKKFALILILVFCICFTLTTFTSAFAYTQLNTDLTVKRAFIAEIDDWTSDIDSHVEFLNIYAFNDNSFNLSILQRSYSGDLQLLLDDVFGFIVAFEMNNPIDSFAYVYEYCSSLNLPDTNIRCDCLLYYDSSFFSNELTFGEVLDYWDAAVTDTPFLITSDMTDHYAVEIAGDCSWIVFCFYNNNNMYSGIDLTTFFDDGYDFPLFSFPTPVNTFNAIMNNYSQYDIAFAAGKKAVDDSKYSQGYNVGYVAGKTDGINIADGRVNNNSASYSYGYSVGVSAAHEYTFNNLLGAVIDAPVNAGLELFNFDLLGINMRGFITALFTLAIIIIVIKFVLVK